MSTNGLAVRLVFMQIKVKLYVQWTSSDSSQNNASLL